MADEGNSYLRAICELLVGDDGPGSLAIGSTLFYGYRPQDAPDACTVVMDRVGASVNTYVTGVLTARIQFLTRGLTYPAAEIEALRIAAYIADLRGQFIDGDGWTWVIHSTDVTSPAFIGQDDKSRFEFSANVSFRLRKMEV